MFIIKSTSIVPSIAVIVQLVCGINCFERIDRRFSTYLIIEPKLYHTIDKRLILSTKKNLNSLQHEHRISLNFKDKDKEYFLDLVLNRKLIANGYFEKYQLNGSYIVNKPNENELEFCHYKGIIRNSSDSWAAISTCNGISGLFFDGNSYHYIQNLKDKSGVKRHFLYKQEYFKTNRTSEFSGVRLKTKRMNHKHTKRSADIFLKGPYHQNDKSRFVELLLVFDQNMYQALDSNLTSVFQYSRDIANIVNSIYVQLNVSIVLVGVVVWTEKNGIEIDQNIEKTLINFLQYRQKHLIKDYPNDIAQLITKIKFNNYDGLSPLGKICTHGSSGGVNNDYDLSRRHTALTIAHEIGHNMGMKHDDDHCQCPDKRCIMSPYINSLNQIHWSSCSVEYLNQAIKRGMDYCLKNKPDKSFEDPVCGNSVVEEGEQCDCGPKKTCDNPCCDPTTCMRYENATCATGQCCDSNTCRLKFAGTECRKVSHECDLPEYCTGHSEFCPENVNKTEGSACKNNNGVCVNGYCRCKTKFDSPNCDRFRGVEEAFLRILALWVVFVTVYFFTKISRDE